MSTDNDLQKRRLPSEVPFPKPMNEGIPAKEHPAQALHDEMVRRLLSQGNFRTNGVEAAFRTVPRHLFLPGIPWDVVYGGEAVVTHRAPSGVPTSSLSMPSIMALMLEQLDVQPGHRVLEIGTGTGYNAALLAVLAGSEGEVTTIDLDEAIVLEAREHLDAAGYPTVRTVCGDGWLGVLEHAPYDRIEATVGIWDLSPLWIGQLRDAGRVVVPLWLAPGAQASVAFRKEGQHLHSVMVEPCGFMRLRGPNAGPEAYVPVQGWFVSLDEPSPEPVAALLELLQTDPRVEPAPAAPAGWRARLALEEPRAIALERADNWRDNAYGILEVATRSLAFIRGSELCTFGSDAARRVLLRRLGGARPFDMRTLSISAIPSTSTQRTEGTIVLRRPNFEFLISEG